MASHQSLHEEISDDDNDSGHDSFDYDELFDNGGNSVLEALSDEILNNGGPKQANAESIAEEK